ncbi:MAG: ABC transporter ATP-binding protein [Candidatus Kerfeldbacteria bacterium]
MAVIEVQNLVKHFGKIKAVDDISFSVEKGEIYGFLGPNGAGKTTTIRCMMDFIRPNSGTITISGLDGQKDTVAVNKKIGYLSGAVRIHSKWTGQEHIDFVSKLNGSTNKAKELAERLNYDTSMKTKKLSSGNKQKLGLIMALLHDPEVLIWDEPTNALDPLLQNEVYELLFEARDKGTTVFMSSHNLTEVEKVCDRVGIIRLGKMVASESITKLKEKKLYTVHAVFPHKTDPKEFTQLESVELIEAQDTEINFRVKGDINPILTKLDDIDLKDVEIHRASLEDIFLEYYENK